MSFDKKEFLVKLEKEAMKVYNHIPSSEWGFNSYSYAVSFGHYVSSDNRFNYQTSRNSEVVFYSRNDSKQFLEITASTGNYTTKVDSKKVQQVGDKALELLKNMDFSGFIKYNDFFNKEKVSKPKNKNIPYIAFGEKAEKTYDFLIMISENKNFSFSTYSEFYFNVKSTGYRGTMSISISNKENVLFDIVQLNTNKVIKEVKNKKDLQDFFDEIEEELSTMIEVEEEILNIIKANDDTAYFSRSNGYLNIFNSKIPFHVSKIHENDKFKYRIRFNTGYNKGTDLDKVKAKVVTKVEAYIKKNRIKAAVSGKAHSLLGRYLNKIYGYHYSGSHLFNYFTTDLNEFELNKLIKTEIEKDYVKLSEDHVKYYQLISRTKGRRHKIVSGFKLGELLCFHASSALFVLTQEEFDSYNIEPSQLKQKKYKEELKELEKFIKELKKEKTEI